jgi:hypothetical protein
VGSVLSGLIIAVVAAWIWHFYGRLWRSSIALSTAPALDEAAGFGLRVRPAPGRAAWVATGRIDGLEVRIAWLGGIAGERSRVDIGGLRRTMPLLCSAEALREALTGAEE